MFSAGCALRNDVIEAVRQYYGARFVSGIKSERLSRQSPLYLRPLGVLILFEGIYPFITQHLGNEPLPGRKYKENAPGTHFQKMSSKAARLLR